jgi:hypothetical protein
MAPYFIYCCPLHLLLVASIRSDISPASLVGRT